VEGPVHDPEPPIQGSPAQALQESEARYRLLVEHAPDAIVMLDMSQGRFVDCNAKAVELFEADRETLLQHGPASLSPPTQPDGRASDLAARDYIRRCLAGEFPAFEWTHRTLGGRDVACEVRLVAMPDQGRPLVRGSITDISWRKDLEREQARLADRLQAAQKLESLGLLAGGIAHDFNNLLAVILGYADLALGAAGTDPVMQDTLDRLRGASLQARELTDQLLVYSGRGPNRQEVVDLSALVAQELAILEVAVGRKGQLRSELVDMDLRVSGDPGQLQQIVLNLVGNAGDALADPSGRIHVSTRAAQLDAETLDSCQIRSEGLVPGPVVQLQVRDTGGGMPPAVLARIFDPFFTTKPEGHGLGLAAVGGIVRSHGGALRVTSREGSGTEFTVWLPATQARAQAAPQAGSAESWRGRGHVLVADDEAAVREVTQALLEALGFTVHAVDSGDAVLAAVLRAPDA